MWFLGCSGWLLSLPQTDFIHLSYNPHISKCLKMNSTSLLNKPPLSSANQIRAESLWNQNLFVKTILISHSQTWTALGPKQMFKHLVYLGLFQMMSVLEKVNRWGNWRQWHSCQFTDREGLENVSHFGKSTLWKSEWDRRKISSCVRKSMLILILLLWSWVRLEPVLPH